MDKLTHFYSESWERDTHITHDRLFINRHHHINIAICIKWQYLPGERDNAVKFGLFFDEQEQKINHTIRYDTFCTTLVPLKCYDLSDDIKKKFGQFNTISYQIRTNLNIAKKGATHKKCILTAFAIYQNHTQLERSRNTLKYDNMKQLLDQKKTHIFPLPCSLDQCCALD